MSKFNATKLAQEDTVNLAGGKAFANSAKTELASILLTSFVTNGFYRASDDTLKRLHELLDRMPIYFAKQAAIVARNVFGMRSITHAAAAHIAQFSGDANIRDFFDKIVVRLDDMSEIISYYRANFGQDKHRKNGKMRLPEGMKKGFKRAFDRFDDYQIAKYRQEDKEVSLIDIVNMVRPVPTAKNGSALKQLVAGTLKQEETHEAMLSAAGSDKEKIQDAWFKLLYEKKLGYLALIRNLKRIIETNAPSIIRLAMAQLNDITEIEKSRVFPFQMVTAYRAVEAVCNDPWVLGQISDACDKSIANLPPIDGKNLIILDVSGSMTCTPVSNEPGTKRSCIELAAPLVAALIKCGVEDVILFGTRAVRAHYYKEQSVIQIVDAINRDMFGGGTNFVKPFELMIQEGKEYDRIFLLSDMQGWVENGCNRMFKRYCNICTKKPYLYSIDLSGLGTSQLKDSNNVFQLAGFSTSLLEAMPYLEKDGVNGIVKVIEKCRL